jgi:hypothetical protein
MAKLTLQDIASGYQSQTAYNENNAAIEGAIENTLSRDGSTPNQMEADFDMNSRRILNLPAPASDNEPARWVDVKDGVSVIGEAIPSQTGNASKSLTTDGSSLFFKQATLVADTLSDLLSADTAGNIYVNGYHTAGDGGGGEFYWDASQDKANHNGGTIIDPDVTFPSDWTNSTQVTTWYTAGTGTGCWIRVYKTLSIKDFGAVGDWNGSTGTDNTTAFQAAIDSLPATGGVVYFPPGHYMYTDTLLLKKNGVHLVGAGFAATRLIYRNAAGGIGVSGDSNKTASTSAYTACSIKGISFGPGSTSAATAANDPDIYIDFTSFSYSYFDVFVQTMRPNAVCFYGQGNNGQSPYFNHIQGFFAGGDGSLGTNYTQTGIKFTKGTWSGGSPGPNANTIGPIPRSFALKTFIDVEYGQGNTFSQVSAESINDTYIKLSGDSATVSSTSTGSNSQVVLNDTTKNYASNLVNQTIVITGGTGAGQSRIIASNTTTAITVTDPWSVIPDATSTYSLYAAGSFGNKFSLVRGEGLGSLNPDFVHCHPGTINTHLNEIEVVSLGSGLLCRNEAAGSSNKVAPGTRILITEKVENFGAGANIDIYPRLSVRGGFRIPHTYILESMTVTKQYHSVGDTLTVTLDISGTTTGNGEISLTTTIPDNEMTACVFPASDEYYAIDSSNKGLFLNVQSGPSYSTVYDTVLVTIVLLAQ